MSKIFRVVPDTNVILSASLTKNSQSPNLEFIERWQANEFVLLYSDDTMLEYIEKLIAKGVPSEKIEQLTKTLLRAASKIPIVHYHTPPFPIDADDIAFLLCAENGEASHLVTHDAHLLTLPPFRTFKICKVVPFLQDLRAHIQKMP